MKARSSAGFTLIEVLVALVIFALMSAMAYRGLTAILDSKHQVDAVNDKWRNVAMLFSRLERDLAVVAPLQIRAANRPFDDALAGEAVATGEYGAQLVFTRMGGADDISTLAAPQRVGYRLRDGNVEVLLWPVLDQASRTLPEGSTVISGVAELRFRYLSAAGQWQTRWPEQSVPTGSTLLPNAVEIVVTLKSGETLTRLYHLPVNGQIAQAVPAPQPGSAALPGQALTPGQSTLPGAPPDQAQPGQTPQQLAAPRQEQPIQ